MTTEPRELACVALMQLMVPWLVSGSSILREILQETS